MKCVHYIFPYSIGYLSRFFLILFVFQFRYHAPTAKCQTVLSQLFNTYNIANLAYFCTPTMNVKHVMSNITLTGYNLIGHVENRADYQREHALKTRVETSEQRCLQFKNNWRSVIFTQDKYFLR